MNTRILSLFLVVALSLLPRVSTSYAAEEYRSDRIIIKPGPEGVANLHAALGTRVLRSYPRFGGIQVVELPAGAVVEQVREAFENSGLVEYAEFDHIYTIDSHSSPNDPSYTDGTLWGLHNTGQNSGTADADIDAPEAWHYRNNAEEVLVAVIDTGVNYTHEDLTKNMWRNAAEENGTSGVDDDGNGYTDDIYGIDAHANDVDPDDEHGHGTHVAGTIGAVGDNGMGIVGVAWRVRIMALRFIWPFGGSTSDAIECINYAIDKGATILNNSWGGGAFNQALYDAIRIAGNAGTIFVAAAGNNDNDNDSLPFYPATYDTDNVVAVGATDRNDDRAVWDPTRCGEVQLWLGLCGSGGTR